jgi:curved DNA-binding protein CbpA
MRMQRNFYEVLGVPRNATKREIKDKYYVLVRQYHPDRAKDKQLADTLFVQINRAYTTLYNDEKRAKYDASLDATNLIPARPGSSVARQPVQQAPEQVTTQQIRAWFDEASRYDLKGDFTQAIVLCTKTLEADPSNFPGLLLMGDLLAKTGKLNEALDTYKKAARIQPSNHLLREKMTRLTGLIERRTTNPGVAGNNAPNGARPASTQQPAPKPEPKSLFDRLINRK